uniref:Group II intron maturase-specific domain-containing protein n=1 Tax=Caulerpa manorensis TaxID=717648 RepID=A0A2P0QI77_9CHLO|nr:hypothetical protein [Caulerpa manorensis]ARO74465.1 hypothetical protein [Caulerpa manorensis]
MYWQKFFYELVKFQKKINQNKSKRRNCRNFQRLLIRSPSIQFLIIGNLLARAPNFNCIFNNIENTIYFYIVDQQWILALSSLMSPKIVFLTGQKNYYIYTHLYKIFKKIVDPQYIMITIFDNFLSKKNKLWILSNLILERKYFLSRIPYFRKQNIYKKNLKTIVQHLCIKDFSSFIQETLGLEYNNIIIRILSHKFYNNQILYDFALTRGLNIQFNKTYPYSSIFFLGWFFDGKIVNIRSHQKEFQKFLNKSQISRYTPSYPLDQIIFELNKKIHHWRNFYNEPNLYKIMNDYFFWRIWFWLKRRHKKKGSKWLYEKYWNQSTSRKWVLSSNNEYLILLRK